MDNIQELDKVSIPENKETEAELNFDLCGQIDTSEVAQFVLKKVLCSQLRSTPLKSWDLTQSQGLLLRKLFSVKESGAELKMTDLSVMLGITKSATSQAVSKLERLGLVKRKWSKADRRKILVGLTAKGSTVAETFNKDVVDFIKAKLEKMDENERRVFIKIFLKCMED